MTDEKTKFLMRFSEFPPHTSCIELWCDSLEEAFKRQVDMISDNEESTHGYFTFIAQVLSTRAKEADK
jgi:hypothetical protein